MKNCTYLVSIFIIVLLSLKGQAQGYLTPYGERKIGESVPDFALKVLGNERGVKLSDYRGKNIILEFWSITCGSCIKKFPFLDSVQHELGDNLQILLVNIKYLNQSVEKIVEVINRVSKQYQTKIILPVVLADVYDKSASIHDYFRSSKLTVVPHFVWINKKGVLAAITGPNEVTRENIDFFIREDKIELPIKDDEKLMHPSISIKNSKRE